MNLVNSFMEPQATGHPYPCHPIVPARLMCLKTEFINIRRSPGALSCVSTCQTVFHLAERLIRCKVKKKGGGLGFYLLLVQVKTLRKSRVAWNYRVDES